MQLAALSPNAAPPARSVDRRTRGRVRRRSVRSPWGASPSRSSRAISEACKVAGTDSAASDVVDNTAATRSACAALSSTALVSSSTKSGTPSLRATISATISGVSAVLPARLCTSVSPSRSPSRLSAKLVTWERPPQDGWNSGRKVITSSTGRRRTRSRVRSSNSREVGSIQWTSSNTISTGRCRASASSWVSSASNSFSRLRCGLRFKSAAELGNDSSSLNSGISSSSRASGASNTRSFPSFSSIVSSRVKPAARSSWAVNGYRALSW